jgi:hypothetical protein
MNDSCSCLRQRGFQLDAALLLAHASDQAYRDTAAWAIGRGLGKPNVFDTGNTQGYWTVAGDVALIAFRGTDNLGHWLRDARALTAIHPWGRVHKGFHGGIGHVVAAMREFKAAAANCAHVWVTGHSLGGALAVLAGAWLKDEGISPQIYTYGQPRMGLAEFCGRFDMELPERLYRIVNQNDIVTRVPGLILDYQHSGKVKRIMRPGVLEARGEGGAPDITDDDLPPASPDEEEALMRELETNPRALDADSERLEGRLMPPFFRHHFIGEYIARLTELCDARKLER